MSPEIGGLSGDIGALSADDAPSPWMLKDSLQTSVQRRQRMDPRLRRLERRLRSLLRRPGISGIVSGQRSVVSRHRAVIPGVSISVANEAGQVFGAVTTASGTFRVPALSNGLYKVTVSSSGFKTIIIENVKVDVDMPASVNVMLEAGDINETVTIGSGAEVLQRETATVGSTITGRQIIETPIPSNFRCTVYFPSSATFLFSSFSSSLILPFAFEVTTNVSQSSDGFCLLLVMISTWSPLRSL